MQTQPEIRARAIELAIQQNKARGGYMTPTEIIDIAKIFEEYIGTGFPLYAPVSIPSNWNPVFGDQTAVPYPPSYPPSYTATSYGACCNNCGCNAGDCNQGC